jgi:hypothetical protein
MTKLVRHHFFRKATVPNPTSALCAFVLGCLVAFSGVPSLAADPPSLAFLGVHFQNDNESLEPTSQGERARLLRTGDEFTQQLAASGRFKIVQTPEALRAKIATGQAIGECGACEIDYGGALGADFVAWLQVQKVSNLILNMNVYISDVRAGRTVLTKSVDLRGNTDESWSRSLKYLVKNSVLTEDLRPSGS